MIINYILKNLILTEIVETTVCFMLGIKNITNYKTVILMNVITNVLFSFITYVIFMFFNINFNIYIIVIETIIIFIEKRILNTYFNFEIEKKFILNKIKTTTDKAFCFSLILNFTSIVFGSIISKFIQ